VIQKAVFALASGLVGFEDALKLGLEPGWLDPQPVQAQTGIVDNLRKVSPGKRRIKRK
jgi:hypothetical protein